MTVTEFSTKYQDGLTTDELILDVRTAQEFLDKHIPGAINIPVDEVMDRVSELESKTVYCICLTGSRSQIATLLLRARGVDAHNVEQGMVAWVSKNLPTE
jgi:rhodanese-related sulfurtransferase